MSNKIKLNVIYPRNTHRFDASSQIIFYKLANLILIYFVTKNLHSDDNILTAIMKRQISFVNITR